MSAEQRSRPRARVWVIAGLELVGALVLARLIVWSDRSTEPHHPMPGMAGMPSPGVHWTWPVYLAGAVAIAAGIWWALRRQPVLGLACAAAAVVVVGSKPVRVLATQSHLVAMVVLEVLLVLVPLAVVSVLPQPIRKGVCWLPLVMGSAIAYAALLIVLHVPAVHHRGAEIGAVPTWLLILLPPIGIVYWFGVLHTGAVVPTRARRAALLGAQEVAAFVGLLSLFGAWGAMAHHSPLGISAGWDQRLGGLAMMGTCAAVAIPIARRLG